MKIAAIVLMLLTVATSATAECVWVLWHQYTFVNWPDEPQRITEHP